MIIGTKFWNDRNCYYIQDNNVFENCFRKKGTKGWLESCGPTSAVNAIVSMKGPDFFASFAYNEYTPQPEDMIMLYLNDPHNFTKLESIRKLNYSIWFGNEIPQLYPHVVKELFDIDAEFVWEHDWDAMIEHLKSGHAVQVCEPGHFTCVVAYDSEANELVYNDPWAGHTEHDEFNRRYNEQFFVEKIAKYKIIYKG